MEWYQPTFAATYSGLRRYGGNHGGSTPDKVLPYCISMRALDQAQTKSGGIVAGTTKTLADGAVALAASAIALGTASLVI